MYHSIKKSTKALENWVENNSRKKCVSKQKIMKALIKEP